MLATEGHTPPAASEEAAMIRRPSPFLKLIAAAALCAFLSACAVYPAGGPGYGPRHGYGYGGGYRPAPSYAYAPPRHGGYGGRGGGWGGGGWGSQRGWR
jgi:hypothetical protein